MSSDKVAIQRLGTGVPGLDTILGGGLPEFSFNLIGGRPGCGKTTLAHQIMFALATPERPALYVTLLGEPPIKMLRYQQQFDFFDPEQVNGAIRFLNLSESVQAESLGEVLKRILAAVEEFGPALVFVDSFRSVTVAHQRNAVATMELQHFVQQLSMHMTSWQATTFLVGEYSAEDETNPVFTVADGLIWLYQSAQGNSVVRKLEVKKMRGQPTLPGLHTFRISSAGISVFAPTFVDHSGLLPTPRVPLERISIGVPALDTMLGGGLPRGYSVLISGPSGSGKSILAAAFLAEGVRRGEPGVMAVFEQRISPSRSRVLSELIADQKVFVVDSGNPDLSVDEVTQLLIAEVRRVGARRVVIDSLSGFELALAPTFRSEFRVALARMVSALAVTGVTVLMTSEIEDRFSELRFSPYGTAFLTDAIIVQRYVEVESQLHRLIAVVKVRESAHSNGLHQFEVDNDGIQIGAKLPDHDGLLGGSPSRRNHAWEGRLEEPR